MARAHVAYPPQPFTLSRADAAVFERLADQLVAETSRTHDDFVGQGRIVDLNRWKPVKEKNNMTAYRTQTKSNFRRDRIASDMTEAVPASPQMPSFYPTVDKKLSETYPDVTFLEADSEDELEEFNDADILEQNVLEKSRPEQVPMVFCTGVVSGTVEDAALGFLADTEARSRMRTLISTNDVAVDELRILARIQGPTEDDPFRFLGIKWCSHSTVGPAGHFIKSRDFLILESTGMAIDSDGERFCYVLNHSIELDEVPNFRKHGFVRMQFSVCSIIRPHITAGAIEIFCRGYVDAGGNLNSRMCTYMFCDGLMTAPGIVEGAYTKKLIWLLHVRHRAQQGLLLASLNVSNTCPCCDEKLHTGFAKLLEGNSMCHICRQTICHKCTAKKTLPIHIGGSKVTQKTMDFCLSCYLEAKNMSAWQVAISTLL